FHFGRRLTGEDTARVVEPVVLRLCGGRRPQRPSLPTDLLNRLPIDESDFHPEVELLTQARVMDLRDDNATFDTTQAKRRCVRSQDVVDSRMLDAGSTGVAVVEASAELEEYPVIRGRAVGSLDPRDPTRKVVAPVDV